MKRVLFCVAIYVAATAVGRDKIIDAKLEKAHQKYDVMMKKSALDYVRALDEAEKAYTKKGDLNEALEIRKIKENFLYDVELRRTFALKGGERVLLTSLTPDFKKAEHAAVKINGGTTTPIIHGEPCEDFIFAHANSLLRYKVPHGAVYFTAIACSPYSKSITFKVLVDGELEFESKALSEYKDELVEIKVKLPKDASTLELITDTLGNSISDHSCWAYPAFFGFYE